MGRSERRLEARTERRLGISAPAPVLARADASRRRRNLGILGAGVAAFLLVFGSTFGSIPVTQQADLPDDLTAAIAAAGQQIRPLQGNETGGFDDLPADVASFAATATGLGERVPNGSFRAAVRKSSDEPWRVALGLLFGGEPVNYGGELWESVIVWVGVDPVQTLFATGYRKSVPPSPTASPTPTPTPSPSATPDATKKP